MKNKQTIALIATAMIVGGASFFGGVQYQKSQRPTNLMFQGRNGARQPGVMQNRPVSGEVTQIDPQSLTVKSPDGSSKIVILSSTTLINKTATGSATDINPGTQVMVIGKTNSDGSLTAETINLSTGMLGRMLNSPVDEFRSPRP